MSPRAAIRRLALSAMVLVTAWSIWGFAQERRTILNPPLRPTGGPGLAASAPPRPRAKPAAPAVSHAPGEQADEQGAKDEESEQPAPMNWTEFGSATPPYVAMLVNFGILAAAYYLLGKKPVADGLKARRDSIARAIEDAERMKHEAEERAKLYQGRLDRLEEEMRSARASLIHAGEAEQERLVREAEANAERMRKDAEFLVEQELKQIQVDLRRDAVEAAVRAAEELLKARVTPADQQRLAEDYLADLGKVQATAPGGRSLS